MLPQVPPVQIPTGHSTPEEIRSAEVPRLTSPDLAGLKRLLLQAETERSRLAAEVRVAVTKRDQAWRSLQRASKLPLRLFTKNKIPALQTAYDQAETRLSEKVAEHDACRVSIDFDFDESVLSAWQSLSAAHHQLSRCAVVWDVTSIAHIDRVTTRSAANRAIERMPVRLERQTAGVVASSSWAGLRFGKANGDDLEIFPGFCLVRQRYGTDFALIELRELQLDHYAQQFVEDIQIPRDAQVVGSTWAKVNKDGSRDRRFADNFEIPVVLYGKLAFVSTTGIREEYMVSSVDAMSAFGEACHSLQSKLETLARNSRMHEVGVAPAWATQTGETPRDGYSVPPLPHVRGAHEFTLAALVALGGTVLAGSTLIASRPSYQTPTISVPNVTNAGVPASANIATVPTSTVRAAQAPSGQPDTAPSQPPQQQTPVVPTTSSLIPQLNGAERVVVKSAANVRTAPSGSALAVRTTTHGTVLKVYERSAGGWVRVGDAQPWGWVHGSLLAPP
jgi:Bacterial SH3 domain